MSRPVRVVLVEDNEVFREALETLLALHEIEIVASLADGSEAVGVCAGLQPDVVVLDYRLPGLDGVEIAAALRHALPEVAIVCLTAEVTPREEEALLAAGATECVLKDASLDEIVTVILRAGVEKGARWS
jgi:DNA-binding NarL/FixJ family response regulator